MGIDYVVDIVDTTNLVDVDTIVDMVKMNCCYGRYGTTLILTGRREGVGAHVQLFGTVMLHIPNIQVQIELTHIVQLSLLCVLNDSMCKVEIYTK